MPTKKEEEEAIEILRREEEEENKFIEFRFYFLGNSLTNTHTNTKQKKLST